MYLHDDVQDDRLVSSFDLNPLRLTNNPDGSHLPIVPSSVLAASLRRLTPEEIDLALRHKLVPIAWLPGRTFFAAASDHGLSFAHHHGLTVAGQITPRDYRRYIKSILGRTVLQRTVTRLYRLSPQFSIRTGASFIQKIFILMVVFGVLLSPMLLPERLQLVLVSSVSCLFFLSVTSLRIFALLPDRRKELPPPELGDADLPSYSVLVPVFKETEVLKKLLKGLCALDYPVEKLDIKIIVEMNDTGMQRALAQLPIPDWFEIIIVPAGAPQTKPRALSYALSFARGEFVVIYDAEDVPDPRQLRVAAAAFACKPREVACLQAQLVFFNDRKNWITRQFAIEYSSLFGVILPALDRHDLPLPLGGTSNHFRREVLESVGAWDPYNVTEDADLGIRLARYGFKTAMIDSVTHEEATCDLSSWIKQRSRWLKGFLLTWFVHMRQPLKTWNDLGIDGCCTMTTMTLGVFLSAALHPFLIGKSIYDLLTSAAPENDQSFHSVLMAVSIMLFVTSYATSFLIGRKGLRQIGIRGWTTSLLSMPVYWLLFMPAAGLALYEIFAAPFHWRKTTHGKSRPAKRQKTV